MPLLAQVNTEIGLGRIRAVLEEHLTNPTSMVGLVVDNMKKHATQSHLCRCAVDVIELGSLAEAFLILPGRPIDVPLVDLKLLFDQLLKFRV